MLKDQLLEDVRQILIGVCSMLESCLKDRGIRTNLRVFWVDLSRNKRPWLLIYDENY
jgi:hypothetical protein